MSQNKFKVGDRIVLTTAGAFGMAAVAGAEAVVVEYRNGFVQIVWDKSTPSLAAKASTQSNGGYREDQFEPIGIEFQPDETLASEWRVKIQEAFDLRRELEKRGYDLYSPASNRPLARLPETVDFSARKFKKTITTVSEV